MVGSKPVQVTNTKSPGAAPTWHLCVSVLQKREELGQTHVILSSRSHVPRYPQLTWQAFNNTTQDH